MWGKKASFFIKHDTAACFEKLLHEFLMFLCKYVWHDLANVLTDHFLFVPSQALFDSLAYFEDSSVLIFVATDMDYYSIITEQNIVCGLLIICRLSNKVNFIGLIEIFLSQLYIIPDHSLVLRIHQQCLGIIGIYFAELLPILVGLHCRIHYIIILRIQEI